MARDLWPVKPNQNCPYICTPCGRSYYSLQRYLAHQKGCPYLHGKPLVFTRNKRGGLVAPLPPVDLWAEGALH